ncbi:copper oxidase, partial [Micromonospora globispora]
MSPTISRRRLLVGIAGTVGLAGTAGAAAWAGGVFDPRLVTPDSPLVAQTEAARR